MPDQITSSTPPNEAQAPDAYERNVEAIAAYLREGEALETRRHLGFEVEHFIVDSATMALVPYSYEGLERGGNAGPSDTPLASGPSVEDILHMLEPLYEGEVHTVDAQGRQRIIGLKRKGAPVTIEPGAQLEVSIGPACTVAELRETYLRFRSEIETLIAPLGYSLVSLGYHPTACAAHIPIIPKNRYAMMNRHFAGTGRHGICMMRGSASTQVSIDFTDEADCIDKMLIATKLGPLLYFLTDNAPMFEGERMGAGGTSATGLPIPRRMARAAIWNDVDADRSMCAGFLFGDDASYEGYARMLLDRPPILTLEDPSDDGTAVYHGDATAAQVYEGRLLTRAEIEHILSMFFFDVRLKQYIEIRMPDSLPMDYALSFAALVKGIFYNDAALDRLRGELKGVDEADIAAAKAALEAEGYGAAVYGKPAHAWLDELMALAREGLTVSDEEAGTCPIDPSGDADDCGCPRVDETAFLEPLAELVATRTTLLDRILGGEPDD